MQIIYPNAITGIKCCLIISNMIASRIICWVHFQLSLLLLTFSYIYMYRNIHMCTHNSNTLNYLQETVNILFFCLYSPREVDEKNRDWDLCAAKYHIVSEWDPSNSVPMPVFSKGRFNFPLASQTQPNQMAICGLLSPTPVFEGAAGALRVPARISTAIASGCTGAVCCPGSSDHFCTCLQMLLAVSPLHGAAHMKGTRVIGKTIKYLPWQFRLLTPLNTFQNVD